MINEVTLNLIQESHYIRWLKLRRKKNMDQVHKAFLYAQGFLPSCLKEKNRFI